MLEFLYFCLQLHHQLHNRCRITLDRQLDLFTLHTARFIAGEISPALDPLNAYDQGEVQVLRRRNLQKAPSDQSSRLRQKAHCLVQEGSQEEAKVRAYL